MGSWKPSSGAANETKTMKATIPTPTQRVTDDQRRSLVARRRRRAASLLAEPGISAPSLTTRVDAHSRTRRVELRVGEVGEQVDRHHGDAEDQGQRLDHRVVAREDRVDQLAAEPGQREDVLDDHQPGEQEPDVESEHGDGRDQRVAEDVLEHDPALAQPAGPRRLDELGLERLDDSHAQGPQQDRREIEADGDRRQRQAAQMAGEAVAVARGRQPPRA